MKNQLENIFYDHNLGMRHHESLKKEIKSRNSERRTNHIYE